MLYKEEREKFGDPSQDAENLRTLCTEIKKAFPDFFNKIQSSPKNSLQSLFFSTPAMRTQYQKYKNLLILDTTFGTNRFHMPLMVGVMVNNMGRSVIAFCALTSNETQEEFSWVLECFEESFHIHPDNVLTDECPSFKAAIKSKWPQTEHFICAWHKSNSIRRILSQKGCYQRKKSKIIKFPRDLIF